MKVYVATEELNGTAVIVGVYATELDAQAALAHLEMTRREHPLTAGAVHSYQAFDVQTIGAEPEGRP